ncbi:MAG: hypothetical protein WB681_00515 [Candidatus Cybelea sp.]
MKISALTPYALWFSVTITVLAGCNGGALTSTGAPSQGTRQSAPRSAFPEQIQEAVSHYYVVNLGTLGGKISGAEGINNRGWISGYAFRRGDNVYRATLWASGRKSDLGTLGGPNSDVPFPVKNDRGVIAGLSEVSQTDPYAEDFCGTGTSHICLGFRWRNGVMTPLPTLGGNNGQANGVNNHGQVVGYTETNTQDPSCQAPQVFNYYGAIWQPNGRVQSLPPAAGDSISAALAANDSGQLVGASGICASPGYSTAVHALLWQAGSTIDLGNLGGTLDNGATAINAAGKIVGVSGVAGNATFHAFLWQSGVMSDLGTLPGDFSSAAYGINNKGQVVGASCDQSGNCRAFLWQNGSMTDVNNLTPPDSPLYVFQGADISDRGWIVGDAIDPKTGKSPAVLLIPSGKADVTPRAAPVRKITLPESVKAQLRRPEHFRPFLLRRPTTPS